MQTILVFLLSWLAFSTVESIPITSTQMFPSFDGTSFWPMIFKEIERHLNLIQSEFQKILTAIVELKLSSEEPFKNFSISLANAFNELEAHFQSN